MADKKVVKKTVVLNLEDENFRVDSVGWKKHTNKQGITFLENSEKDIWEYVRGVSVELVGQQLLTFPAAMRETKKAGKRMPTDEEWNSLEKDILKKNSLFPGNYNTNGAFYYPTSYAHFWSSSVSGGNAWIRRLHSSNATVDRGPGDQTYGFSVRCLKTDD
ncbi:MAG: hypothetical protein KAV41_00645 [Candidatus Pacebacteria bacterium]|nr:hypothetical protein [Candidatus Paceibacterota bacterium]